MFTVTKNPEFTHEVRVQVPVDGGHEEQTFKARFRVGDDSEDLIFTDVAKVKAYLRDIVIGMEDLIDRDGRPISYSDGLRDQMIALPHVRIALLRTYRNALAKERAGN